MQVNDFLLCTFFNDTNDPKITYVAQITEINYFNETFNCYLVDTFQRFQFKYSFISSESWEGTDLDDNSNNYFIDTHYIYTANLIFPFKAEEVAIITFADGQGYLCYIEVIDETTHIIMYNNPYYRLSISNESIITESDWETFPIGEVVTSIHVAFPNNQIIEYIELMREIDSNSDKIITHLELLVKNFGFDQMERWIENLKYVNDYTLDTIIRNYINGVLKNSEDIVVIIDSLAVDTDGPATEEFPHGDKYQRDTFDYPYKIDSDYIYEQGKFSPRNFADEVPYIVRRGKLPDGRRVMDVIEKGDFGVVIYNGKVMPLAAMDSKSHDGKPFAEASVCIHESLGHNPFPVRGSGRGLVGEIEIIMFPNSTLRKDSSFIYNKTEIERKVRLIQFERLSQMSIL